MSLVAIYRVDVSAYERITQKEKKMSKELQLFLELESFFLWRNIYKDRFVCCLYHKHTYKYIRFQKHI